MQQRIGFSQCQRLPRTAVRAEAETQSNIVDAFGALPLWAKLQWLVEKRIGISVGLSNIQVHEIARSEPVVFAAVVDGEFVCHPTVEVANRWFYPDDLRQDTESFVFVGCHGALA